MYIDWNRNGNFDANEQAYTSAATTNGPHLESGNISIPLTASAGVTRMRVFVVEFGSASSSPNSTYSWGETEDYIINVLGMSTQNASLNYTWNETARTRGGCRSNDWRIYIHHTGLNCNDLLYGNVDKWQ